MDTPVSPSSPLHESPPPANRGPERFLWLVYLGFLFLPLLLPLPRGDQGRDWSWLGWTLLSVVVFLWLYFRQYAEKSRTRPHKLPDTLRMLGIAALGYGLTPVNPQGLTYLIYAAGFAPWIWNGVARPLSVTCGLLLLYAVELLWLDREWFNFYIAVLFCSIVCLANCFMVERQRKNAALSMSQEEVRRLATLAERERIGRDLHDLLGHTLSLIAIKSELAARLLAKDPPAAAREIQDVTDVARQALKQVRTAVSGIRAAALDVELLSARALLQSSGIELFAQRDAQALPADIETHLAMMMREAMTNIHKHSQARRANIEVSASNAGVTLVVTDDGRGGVTAYGNGLQGIDERARALGGKLQVTSSARGTVLNVYLPLTAANIVTQPASQGAAS